MLPIRFTKTMVAASATKIATSQTPLAAGNLTLNGAAVSGGVATLDTARRVIITSGGNDTGKTFTVYGTNGSSQIIVDQFAGASGAAAQSNLDFKTVTRIAVDAATASTVTAGTNGVGSSDWVMLNPHVTPTDLFVQGSIASGSPTWKLEYTMDDFWTPAPPVGIAVTPVPVAYDTTLTNQTTAANFTLTVPCTGLRLTITAIASAGGVTIEATQAGITGRA